MLFCFFNLRSLYHFNPLMTYCKNCSFQPLFSSPQASCLHIHGSSVCSSDMCQPFVKVCQRTGCSLPRSLPLCLFSARCWIGSINKTTLKMKVQTLGDTSSLTSCSLFGSLSTNHWAGPQEVAICGHHGDRVCGSCADADVLSGADEV